MDVFLTGITGSIGEPLAQRLAADPGIDRIVGVSRRPLPSSLIGLDKIEHIQADLRDAQTYDRLKGADTLVHSAFAAYGRDQAKLRQANIEGSIKLFEQAFEHGVDHIVFFSSVAAYGAHPDNPIPLTEERELRPNPESWYGSQKAELEEWLVAKEKERVDLSVLRIRPVMVLGQTADLGAETLRRTYRHIVPAFRSNYQLYQFIRTEDLVEATVRAVKKRVDGALNAAGPGWLSPRELAEITGGRLIYLPVFVDRMAGLLQRLGLTPVGEERAVLARHPLVLDARRLTEILGVKPLSSELALRQFMADD